MTRILTCTMLLLTLCLSSCMDGIEVEQERFRRFPDEKIYVVATHEITPQYWIDRGLDSVEYRQYLLNLYGSTRRMSLRDRNNINRIYAEFEVPTLNSNRPFQNCTTIEGVIILVDEGVYDLYDDEGSELVQSDLVFNYAWQDCELLAIDPE